MFEFLFNEEKKKEIKEIKNYVGQSISKDEALKRLSLSEKDLKDFLVYKSLTPLQRVMADLNYKEDLMSLLLMTNTYYTANEKELLFIFQTAESFEKALAEHINTLKIIPNRLTLIKAIYNLYGLYYAKINGTKEEQLIDLAVNSKLPLDVENIEKATMASKESPYTYKHISISTSERRKQKRQRQKQRKLDAKAKEAIQSI